MKISRRIKVVGILAMILCVYGVVWLWMNNLTEADFYGTYINNNRYQVLEGPKPVTTHGLDTLRLHSDGTFDSRTWGNGTYEVREKFGATTVHLHYESFGERAGYGMSTAKPVFGPLRLWLDHDLNAYFEKLD